MEEILFLRWQSLGTAEGNNEERDAPATTRLLPIASTTVGTVKQFSVRR